MLKLANSFDDSAIFELKNLKKAVSTQKFKTDTLKASLYQINAAIAERYIKKGTIYEVSGQFEEAISCYDQVSDCVGKKDDLFHTSQLRKHIALLKSTDNDSAPFDQKGIEQLLNDAKRSNVVIDLAYRYAIFLLKYQDLEQANHIIETYLPSKSKDVSLLKSISNNLVFNREYKKLEKLNSKIEKINSNTLSTNEATILLADVTEIISNNTVLKDFEINEKEYQDGIVDYIIKKLFEQEQITNCNHAINKYKDIINDNIAFKNKAIACMGIIECGKMTKSNYRELISICISAVYQVKLFIDSLKYTKWDDQITFTLHNTLGDLHKKDKKGLPKNVNFDEPRPDNISIRDVQKNMLLHIDSLINKGQYEEDFKNTCIEFLEYETKAIESLCKLELGRDIFLCCPYLANQEPTLHEQITKALSHELQNKNINTEEVLKTGLVYNIRKTQFTRYSEALILKNKAIEIVKQEKSSQITLLYTKANIKKIRTYEHLFAIFCSELIEIFKKQTQDEIKSTKTIKRYLTICKAISDTRLDHLVSNYANRCCVSMHNENSSDIGIVLELMADVYSVIRSNDRLNENLQIIINAAVFTYLMKDEISIKGSIIKAIENTNGELIDGLIESIEENLEAIVFSGKFEPLNSILTDLRKSSASKIKINQIIEKANDNVIDYELNQIISDLNSGLSSKPISNDRRLRIKKSSFLERTVTLYKKRKNHLRLCENLVIICGNLISSEILNDTSESADVMRILDELIPIRSSTFIECAAVLSRQRIDLLSKIDPEIRAIIKLNASNTWQLRHFLTQEGISFAIALEYMKKLSD